jgi:hypothetical protein
LQQARRHIDASFADADIIYVPELWRIKAEIELATARAAVARTRPQHVESAARCLHSAIDLARQHGTRLFELRATVALTRLRRGGDGTRERLAALCRHFADSPDAPDLGAAAAVLRQVASKPR